MRNQENRIRVVAVNNNNVHSKFDIYLDFPEGREWLMLHRHDGILFNMLRDGMSLRELRQQSRDRKDRVKYLIKVIDEYISEEKSA